MAEPAILALEDGTVLSGISVGAEGRTLGEVVFNTAITGYQEILTDPSYYRQIVTLTYPHIGNVGTNSDDFESPKIFAAGLIIRDLSLAMSSWRAEDSLERFLRRGKAVAIAEIDTRRLTRLLRDKGAQAGCIVTGAKANADEAIRAARKFPGLKGMDLARLVSTKQAWPTHWIDRLGDCAPKMGENTQTKVAARSSIGSPPLRLIHRDTQVDHLEYVNSGRIDPGDGDDISSRRDAVQR